MRSDTALRPGSSLPLAVAAALALAAAPAASGHVTVNPPEAAAESFSRFAIRVPTERPNASTTKITVQLPEGLFFVSFQPKAGWKRTVEVEKLAEPVEIFGEEITERVATVTWSGGKIGPGEFDEFGLSARIPEAEGEELVFPAVQTYSNGEVVRWIGPADAEQPAPRVAVGPPEEEEGEEAATAGTATEPAQPAAGAGTREGDEGSGRANLALALSAVALLAGLGALAVSALRPRPR